MREFKFLRGEGKFDIETTIPSPVDVTIHRAIITSSVITFIECRDNMMYRQPGLQYVYGGYTSFSKDNIRYYYVSTLDEVRGRHYDNYILLHDAREIDELEYIVTSLQERGATEMF